MLGASSEAQQFISELLRRKQDLDSKEKSNTAGTTTIGEIDDDDDGMPRLNEMADIADEFVNSCISTDYAKNWGLKEGIRELIQNAVDGMATFMMNNGGKKSDWEVRIKEHTTLNNETYRTFDFNWPKHDKIIGRFTYNPDRKELVLENPGSLKRFNFLLGGSGNIKKENQFSVNFFCFFAFLCFFVFVFFVFF